jgi:putative endonuclease
VSVDPADPRARRLEALAFGAETEARVANALVEDGWRVLARNWRGAGGEIDLVVEREGRLRFVEVKARSGDDDLAGLEAIGEHKQRRLRGAAEAFLANYEDLVDEACFLVAWVAGGTIEWIDDAFDG